MRCRYQRNTLYGNPDVKARIEAAEGFIATIQELIDLGGELVAREGM